jgi:parallel beta-helix repeat protein
VVGSSGAGILFLESSRGRASGNYVASHQVGIQVGGSAAPSISGNTVGDVSGEAIVIAGTGTPTVSGNTCEDGGITLVGGANPALSGNDCAISSSG